LKVSKFRKHNFWQELQFNLLEFDNLARKLRSKQRESDDHFLLFLHRFKNHCVDEFDYEELSLEIQELYTPLFLQIPQVWSFVISQRDFETLKLWNCLISLKGKFEFQGKFWSFKVSKVLDLQSFIISSFWVLSVFELELWSTLESLRKGWIFWNLCL
jgi:hypothetical protein